jgi:hypothetical protein
MSQDSPHCTYPGCEARASKHVTHDFTYSSESEDQFKGLYTLNHSNLCNEHVNNSKERHSDMREYELNQTL